MSTEVDGDKHTTKSSDDDCAKGTARFSPPQAPLLDSLHQDDDEDMGLLLDHSKYSGKAPIDG
jgi:hypothetical protein